MKVRLVLERKRKRVWTTQLRSPEATLGRAIGCTIRIPSSAVSRLHCRLRVERSVVTVEDLESVNGTFLNGTRIRDIEMVNPGDRLTIGPATFLVEYDPVAGGVEPANEKSESIELKEDKKVRKATPPPEPVEVVEEEAGEDQFILDDEEMKLPEGGDLRSFLLELDDTDELST